MRFLDKMVLVPFSEWKERKSLPHDMVDKSTMTDSDIHVNTLKEMKSVGTMTDIPKNEEKVPFIAILPPGIPKKSALL